MKFRPTSCCISKRFSNELGNICLKEVCYTSSHCSWCSCIIEISDVYACCRQVNEYFFGMQDEVVPFVSSLFLRALLSPGVYCNAVLRQTFGNYNKHFTDSEFGSFTVDGLKSEILSLIEHQVL